MIRKLTTLLLFVLFCSSLYSQTTPISFTVEPFGVSPRDVAKSTTDIYTSPFTGLKNVGVNSQMYFKAVLTGQAIGTVTWSVTRRPLGSTAAVGTTVHVVDNNTVIVTFKPDRIGAYELTATSGAYSATVGFNSAKYLGYTNTFVDGVNKNVNCQTCHPSYVTEWLNTGHATTLSEQFEGKGSSSFGANCVSCHSTGHNTTAANDGFDDFTFTFPTVLAPGMTATLIAQFPNAMLRANVQCESCHGPGSTHLGATTDFRMVATYNPEVCAYCHDSGTHHLLGAQFNASVHSGVTSYPTGPGRESCVKCHTGAGFKQFVEGIPTSDPYFDVSYSPVTCAGCHDPHNATNIHQLRTVTASLLAPNNTRITINQQNAGTGAICYNCHQSRSEANAAAAGTMNERFGPHYSAQGDILFGSNMFELGGVKLAKSNHFGATFTQGSCVACHMSGIGTAIDATGIVVPLGGHSFSVRSADGKSNMESCMPCHGGTLGLSFEDVTFMFNGSLDHDNDGVNEGLQDEVKGMIDKIYAEVARQAGTTVIPPVPANSWSQGLRKAYWNARTAYYDHSYGIHNPKYIVSALKGAMASIGLATSVEQDQILPTEYALFQNYPNPFNPTTNIKFAIPKASNVRVTIYDALGKEVRTLVNNYLNAGTHTFEFNARHLASGIYLYRIEADNFVKVNKMLLLK